MKLYETTTHPFIIKIWIEEISQGSGPHQKQWRGHITHVPSGNKKYLQSADDIKRFVAPYLASDGVEFE